MICYVGEKHQRDETVKMFPSRFVPAYVKLREELAAKTVGDIYSVNVNFGVVITSDRVFKKELGGGAVLDIGVYSIQVLCKAVLLKSRDATRRLPVQELELLRKF